MRKSQRQELIDFLNSKEGAWYDLNIYELENLYNPLLNRSQKDIENPDFHLLKILRNPKYFGFTCEHILNFKPFPFQVAILQELWNTPFPMLVASRGASKSTLLAIYSILKCLLIQNTKVIMLGAGLRQSKIVFEYMEHIWYNAPILRSMCHPDDKPSKAVDRCKLTLNNSYAIALPVGDGTKIRGLRANVLVADEFQSQNPQIYEVAVQPFTAVSQTPVENAQQAAYRKRMVERGLWNEELEALYGSKLVNQSILAGTADFSFNHFASYWSKHKNIIESRGDHKRLEELFHGEMPPSLSWKDYSVMRIPYELLPEGLMEEKTVSRAKATMEKATYLREYGCCFVKDSDGFFKRSLIEACVSTDNRPIVLPSGPVVFDAKIKGDPNLKYMYGVDPASEKDNFTICVLELHNDHTRIVHMWSTNRKNFRDRINAGLIKDQDYYGFCARKIRNLMRTFHPARIGMDSQGGGIAVLECLQSPERLESNELQIWPIIDPDKPADTDHKPGLHLVELVNFASQEWVTQANHSLKADFGSRTLLFPRYDNVAIALALEEDQRAHAMGDESRIYDGLDDVYFEIEELKSELSIIQYSQTINGRDRWDTPEVKEPGGKKGRLRKDRYSALIIANMLAHTASRYEGPPAYQLIGGNVRDMVPFNKLGGKPLYNSNHWYQPDGSQFIAIRRT